MTMPSEQLKALGYSISSKLIEDNYNGHKGNHKHMVTISLEGKSMECEHTSGCASRHMPGCFSIKPVVNWTGRLTVLDRDQNLKTIPDYPELADVMYSLLLDSQAGRDAMTFEEFCDDFVYDADSIKVLKIYDACLEQYTKMRRLGVDFESLDRILEDY